MVIRQAVLGIAILCVTLSAVGQTAYFPPAILAAEPSPADFRLADSNRAVNILIDKEDSQTIRLCARLFAEDVERVTGRRPLVVTEAQDAGSECVIIGSIESSKYVKRLINRNKIDVSETRGNWEACLTQVVGNPMPGIASALVIAGSDRRGAAYGAFELSKAMGVSPWYFFADVPVKKKERIVIKSGRYLLKSPTVRYRGIFINDEMWGLRPWAMFRHAPAEGRGIGPTTYADIFELMLRLRANLLWPAMHQKTKPFNYYPQNKAVADEYAIVMGSSHIEPMLRNNMGGAEWETEYPGEPWDYVKNRDHIFTYWETRVKENGRYENMYTLGKRGQDDEAGSDITVPVLERIISDQRSILKKWVNRDVSQVPQVLIAYTEVLDLYNKGLKLPDDVIVCWPDDNFGNIRQLPDKNEQRRSGGSGIYYHFQWLNGATTAYTWTCTTPLALTWYEMKKAWDFGADRLWVVNVGDIKPAEINIDFFMELAWDVTAWNEENTSQFVQRWAEREFGPDIAPETADILQKHYELGYARRPENLVMFNGREEKLDYEWFSIDHYDDEAQQRIEDYQLLIERVERAYEALPDEMKDAFFQTVVYNVKGTALQNLKVLYAQKSHAYGLQRRSSAAVYAAKAQLAEDGINQLIHHYNRELRIAGDKWDHMASLPGPWGGQWHQWDMPPLSTYSGAGEPVLNIDTEGLDSARLPSFSVYNRDRGFIDLFNTGNGAVYWKAVPSASWIRLSETKGVIYDERRVWVDIDWTIAPKGQAVEGQVEIYWSSSNSSEWSDWNLLTEAEKEASRKLDAGTDFSDQVFRVGLELLNPESDASGKIKGYVESNGYISIEAEHFARTADHNDCGWRILRGLGRTGNSVTVFPTVAEPVTDPVRILAESPRLEYDIHTFTIGEAVLQVNCSPVFPINKHYGQRIAVSLDDGMPVLIPGERPARSVMENLMTLKGRLNLASAGSHTLKIWMVDPGVIIDKIIIDFGGVRKSYLGPPESALNR